MCYTRAEKNRGKNLFSKSLPRISLIFSIRHLFLYGCLRGGQRVLIFSNIYRDWETFGKHLEHVLHILPPCAIDKYEVSIALPNGKVYHDVKVFGAELDEYAALIGMGIITRTDFLITNENGKTTFQFRTPSEGGVNL